MKKTIRNLFLKVPAVCLLSLSMLLTSCVSVNNEMIPEESTVAETTENPILNAEYSPSPEQPTVSGIATVEFPNIENTYYYDDLPEKIKTALSYFSQIIAEIISTDGKEPVAVDFESPIYSKDIEYAKYFFADNFGALKKFILKFIYPVESENEIPRMVYGLRYTASAYGVEEFEHYIYCIDETQSILASLAHDGSDYGKALAIARWITDNVEYSYDYEEREAAGDDVRTVYAALKNREVVCEGYARLFDHMCKLSGLETIYISGIAGGDNHAWNMIQISNNWYHVDTTWMISPELFYRNFMMPDAVCFSNGILAHTSVKFGLVNSIGYDYRKIPKATSFDMYKYYFKSIDEFVSCFSNDSINVKMFTIFLSSDELLEKFKSIRGRELKNIDGNIYYIVFEKDISDKSFINVNFTKKKGG